jgi:hypothetical protein
MTTATEPKTRHDPQSDRFWTKVQPASDGKMDVEVILTKDISHWPRIGTYLPTEHAKSAIEQVALGAPFLLEEALGAEMTRTDSDTQIVFQAKVDPKGKTPEQIADAAMEAIEGALKAAHNELERRQGQKTKFVEGIHQPQFRPVEDPNAPKLQPENKPVPKHTRW